MNTTVKVALIAAGVTVLLMRLAAHTELGRKVILGGAIAKAV